MRLVTAREIERSRDPVTERDRLVERASTGSPRPELRSLLLAGRFPGFRALERLALLDACPDFDALIRLSQFEVERLIQRTLRRSRWNREHLERHLEIDQRWLEKDRHHLIWLGDEAFPPLLREIYDVPPVLFGQGNLEALEALASGEPALAVVGTRKPDQQGRETAWQLGRELAVAGISVVSGLARGIDGAVHRGVVAVAGNNAAPPVAVLGSGVDVIYPRDHIPLAVDILNSSGLILSEYAPGTPPQRHFFPARNRIVVGLSSGLVLIQAPEHSGALISAELAQEIGLEVMVHAVGRDWTGGRALIQNGAIEVADLEAVIAEVFPDRINTCRERSATGSASEKAAALAHPALAAFGGNTNYKTVTEFRSAVRRTTTHA